MRFSVINTRLFSSSTANGRNKNNESKTYIIHFDSQIDSKTKDTGMGIAIYDSTDGSKVWSGHRFLSSVKTNASNSNNGNEEKEGAITRNVSDYMALLDGLRIAYYFLSSTSTSTYNVEIQSANDLIVKHLQGKNRVSSKNIKPWYEKITQLMKEFDHVTTGKIDRSSNKFVTKEATMAIQKEKSDENYLEMMQILMSSNGGGNAKLKKNSVSDDNDNNSSRNSANIEIIESEKDVIAESKQHTSENFQDPASLMDQLISKREDPMSATLQSHPPNSKRMEPQINSLPTQQQQLQKQQQQPQQSEEGKINPNKTYILRFDGGSRGNPGNAGSGMVLYDSTDGSELWCGHRFLGTATNNEAEYMGLITGLQCALSLGVRHIVVQGDSQLVLRQVDGIYQVKSPTLKAYHGEAMGLKREFESFETSHIARAENARADELANAAMDLQSSDGFNVAG